ncbi:unnamed protein product [Amoebophrya sp. A120]|nr:unnamed protein product [Amoebophrya sp. A120]|eukprot:GSA120T00003920001.1
MSSSAIAPNSTSAETTDVSMSSRPQVESGAGQEQLPVPSGSMAVEAEEGGASASGVVVDSSTTAANDPAPATDGQACNVGEKKLSSQQATGAGPGAKTSSKTGSTKSPTPSSGSSSSSSSTGAAGGATSHPEVQEEDRMVVEQDPGRIEDPAAGGGAAATTTSANQIKTPAQSSSQPPASAEPVAHIKTFVHTGPSSVGMSNDNRPVLNLGLSFKLPINELFDAICRYQDRLDAEEQELRSAHSITAPPSSTVGADAAAATSLASENGAVGPDVLS